MKIYSINNKTALFLEKYIFDRGKKSKIGLVFSRFKVVFGAGFGSGFVISRNGSEVPDPNQNETDPKHWYRYILNRYNVRSDHKVSEPLYLSPQFK